jgi:signal transduction histidine kinase
VWAVPLWSARGIIGVLLLGEKNDGGLYTQEEIEIGRASGERLIDARASAEMAARLMNLQRQQLAESQVLDRRVRRRLHDDVLPRIHAALMQIDPRASPEAVNLLTDVHHQIADLLRDAPGATQPALQQSGLIEALKQLVKSELADAFDAVTWQVTAEAERGLPHLSRLTLEVLYYAAREALRNAARYGRAGGLARPLHVWVCAMCDDSVRLIIEDNGVGIASPTGTPETPESERRGGRPASGQGLALHSTLLAIIGGTLTIESERDQFTRVSLGVPIVLPLKNHHAREEHRLHLRNL